jgi:translation initiation factor 2 alpha subunit (eIF-2alpha)
MSGKDVMVETRVVAAPRYSITLLSHEPKRIKKAAEEVLAKINELSKEDGGILKILEEKA